MSVYITNPLAGDTDLGGIWDGEEVDIGSDPTDPADDDRDRDGLTNSEEESIGSSEAIFDTDADGLSDGAEVLNHLTNPLLPDSDGDGLGDGQEVNTTLTNPLEPDSDGGGVEDGVEVQEGTNPNNAEDDDADGDGVGYSDERLLGTDPTNADSDNDGLNDGEEVYVYNTNPLVADTDLGGVSDGDEVVAGTDPTDESDDYDVKSNASVDDSAAAFRPMGCSCEQQPLGFGPWFSLVFAGLAFWKRRFENPI